MSPLDDPAPLPDRSVVVLRLLARNVPRREIARRLSCSPTTVDRRMSEARDRYGVGTTIEAIVRAVRSGII